MRYGSYNYSYFYYPHSIDLRNKYVYNII